MKLRRPFFSLSPLVLSVAELGTFKLKLASSPFPTLPAQYLGANLPTKMHCRGPLSTLIYLVWLLVASTVAFRVQIGRRSHHHLAAPLAALKPGVVEMLAGMRDELAAMEAAPVPADGIVDPEREEKLRTLRTVCQCAEALATIDRDLDTFQEQLNSDDDKLKQIAESFQKEFLECKEQIETQLNALL